MNSQENQKIKFIKMQNREITLEIKRLSHHLHALVDINDKECGERDKAFNTINPTSTKVNAIEDALLQFTEEEYNKLSEQYASASNTKLVVQLNIRSKQLSTIIDSLSIRKKQLEMKLKYPKKQISNEFDEEYNVQSLTLAKDKLNKVKTNLHKIKGSPIKRDITKYQALLEECQQLHIDPFFTPDNSKLNALKDKQEYKKQLIASIANLESKKKVIVNETKKVQNAYSQTIDTLSQQFNELDIKANLLQRHFDAMMNRSESPYFNKHTINKHRILKTKRAELKFYNAAVFIQIMWRVHTKLKNKSKITPMIQPAEQSEAA